MAEQIKETDTLNQGRIKINAAIDLANESSEKVDSYKATLDKGVVDAKKIATDAGEDAKKIATEAGNQANQKADKAIADSATSVTMANNAMSRANQNKQEFDALENEFQDLVAESGDSNPEIVQARTDSQGIKQTTLQSRLTKDFSERMTTADAVQMFSGPINTAKMMDLSGKTAGNTSNNPHSAYSDNTATSLKKPSAVWNEMSQDNYNKLAGRDDSGVSTGATQNSVIPQQRDQFDILETVKQLAPNIFTNMDTADAVKFVKDNFVSFSLSVRGKASSPNNKILKVATFLESADSYTTQIQETATDYSDFKIDINDSNFIGSDGKLNVLVYSDSSNGVTAASIDIDYIGVQLTVSLNPLSVLESSGFVKKEYVNKENVGLSAVDNVQQAPKIEFDTHVSNKKNPHGVTKEQVGLGNVPNYGIATQGEAENGEATDKIMTPLSVKASINKNVPKATKELAEAGIDATTFMTPSSVKQSIDYNTDGFQDYYIESGFQNGMSGWVRFERSHDWIACTFSILPPDLSGNWKEILSSAQIPENFKMANAKYTTGVVNHAQYAEASTASVYFDANLQFGTYIRSNSAAPAFTGFLTGPAKIRRAVDR